MAMKKDKLTKTKLAKQLEITSQAISIWQKEGKIPAESCIKLEPIINIKARDLFLDPGLLFDMFDYKKKENNK